MTSQCLGFDLSQVALRLLKVEENTPAAEDVCCLLQALKRVDNA